MPFTYTITIDHHTSGDHQCTALIKRPDGAGTDIATFTSKESISRARHRARKWAEKRVAFLNAEYPNLPADNTSTNSGE